MMTMAELTRIKTLSGWADDDHDSVCDDCGEPYIADHDGDNSKLCHQCAQIMVHDDVPKLLDEIERLQEELDEKDRLLKSVRDFMSAYNECPECESKIGPEYACDPKCTCSILMEWLRTTV